MSKHVDVENDDQDENSDISSFKCAICFSGKAAIPHLMKCCNKIFCGGCIQKWLSKNKNCPHCRKHSRLEDAVNIDRLFSVITEVFDNLIQLCYFILAFLVGFFKHYAKISSV
jgi:hypothetical protein